MILAHVYALDNHANRLCWLVIISGRFFLVKVTHGGIIKGLLLPIDIIDSILHRPCTKLLSNTCVAELILPRSFFLWLGLNLVVTTCHGRQRSFPMT